MRAASPFRSAAAALVLVAAFSAPAALPSGIVAVDYVESTGSQYVDTGLAPSTETRVWLRYAFTDTTTGGTIFGYAAAGSGTTFRFIRTIGSAGEERVSVTRSTFYGDYDRAYSNATPSTAVHVLEAGPTGVYADREKVAEPRTFTSCAAGYLFADKFGWGGQGNYTKARIYGCMIFNYQWPQKVFIPVRDAQNRGAFYELIGGTLCYAQGGNLVPGPDAADQDVTSVRRVDWVASPGYSYVDTGFKPGKDTILNLRFSFLDDKFCAFFGVGANGSGRSFYGIRNSTAGSGREVVRICRDEAYDSTFTVTNEVAPAGIRTCDVAPRRTTLDGRRSSAGLVLGDCCLTAYLFDLHAQWLENVAPTNQYYPARMKVYGCELWNAADVGLAGQRNLVPARFGPLPGLYDIVNHAFRYSSGGQTLVAGPDSDDQDLGTATAPERLVYVESDGSRYIDTQVKASDATRLVLKFRFADTVSSGHFFGYGATGSGRSFRLDRSVSGTTGLETLEVHHGPTYGDSCVYVPLGAASTRVHTLDVSNDAYLLDGVSVGTPIALGGTCAGPCFLGTMCLGWSSDAPALGIPLQVFRCQIYESGTLLRNYVPSHYRGMIGFYDSVRGCYCGGGFTAGPVREGVAVVVR